MILRFRVFCYQLVWDLRPVVDYCDVRKREALAVGERDIQSNPKYSSSSFENAARSEFVGYIPEEELGEPPRSIPPIRQTPRRRPAAT